MVGKLGMPSPLRGGMEKEVLTYRHLKDVIEVSARFDGYSENIHRGGLMQA